jgi:hypothetical protein
MVQSIKKELRKMMVEQKAQEGRGISRISFSVRAWLPPRPLAFALKL